MRAGGDFDTSSLPDRIRATIAIDDSGCWIWQLGKDRDGYGLAFLGKRKLAHRLVYELLVGPIPEGLVIDHLCRVRACVNPGHLEPVTNRVNVLRGETLPAANAAKTHCPKGHPYSGSNVVVVSGSRCCRACARERARRQYRRKRSQATS